jgi:hypothetical protein
MIVIEEALDEEEINQVIYLSTKSFRARESKRLSSRRKSIEMMDVAGSQSALYREPGNITVASEDSGYHTLSHSAGGEESITSHGYNPEDSWDDDDSDEDYTRKSSWRPRRLRSRSRSRSRMERRVHGDAQYARPRRPPVTLYRDHRRRDATYDTDEETAIFYRQGDSKILEVGGQRHPPATRESPRPRSYHASSPTIGQPRTFPDPPTTQSAPTLDLRHDQKKFPPSRRAHGDAQYARPRRPPVTLYREHRRRDATYDIDEETAILYRQGDSKILEVGGQRHPPATRESPRPRSYHAPSPTTSQPHTLPNPPTTPSTPTSDLRHDQKKFPPSRSSTMYSTRDSRDPEDEYARWRPEFL